MHNEEYNRIWMQILYQTNMVWIHPALIFKSISAWNVDAEHDDVDENTVNVVEDCAWHDTGF